MPCVISAHYRGWFNQDTVASQISFFIIYYVLTCWGSVLTLTSKPQYKCPAAGTQPHCTPTLLSSRLQLGSWKEKQTPTNIANNLLLRMTEPLPGGCSVPAAHKPIWTRADQTLGQTQSISGADLGNSLMLRSGTTGKGRGLNAVIECFLSNAMGRSLIFILKCKKSICCIEISSITTYPEQPAPRHSIRMCQKARFSWSKKSNWNQLFQCAIPVCLRQCWDQQITSKSDWTIRKE